jgi:chromosome segregation ATPase
MLNAEKGHNRFLWDFRTDDISPDVKNVYIYGSYAGYAVPPGKYKAELNVNGTISETDITLLSNPNIVATEKDWTEQQQVLRSIVTSISEMHQKVNELRKVKKQLNNQIDVLKDNKSAEKIIELAKSLIKDIDAWEANIVEGRIQNGQDVINWPSKLNAEFFNIKGLADATNPKITEGIKTRLADLQGQWSKEKAASLNIKKSIEAYNEQYKSLKLDPIQL